MIPMLIVDFLMEFDVGSGLDRRRLGRGSFLAFHVPLTRYVTESISD